MFRLSLVTRGLFGVGGDPFIPFLLAAMLLNCRLRFVIARKDSLLGADRGVEVRWLNTSPFPPQVFDFGVDNMSPRSMALRPR